MEIKLTEQEKNVLKEVPTGWFYPDDIPYYYRARGGICSRLKKKGVLASRLSEAGRKQIDDGGGVPSNCTEYRYL